MSGSALQGVWRPDSRSSGWLQEAAPESDRGDSLRKPPILIVGRGRAGQRWSRLLELQGHKVWTVDSDPDREAHFQSLEQALKAEPCPLAIIATPPNLHLDQAQSCLEAGLERVLIEKPLCSWDQLDQASRLSPAQVSVAYNWLFHPWIQNLDPGKPADLYLAAFQHRPERPAWGFLLDQISHDLSIVLYLLGSPLRISCASHFQDRNLDSWVLSGQTGPGRFWILDNTWAQKVDRRVLLALASERQGFRKLKLPVVPLMFHRLWDAFLAGQLDNLDLALEVQKALEQARTQAGEG